MSNNQSLPETCVENISIQIPKLGSKWKHQFYSFYFEILHVEIGKFHTGEKITSVEVRFGSYGEIKWITFPNGEDFFSLCTPVIEPSPQEKAKKKFEKSKEEFLLEMGWEKEKGTVLWYHIDQSHLYTIEQALKVSDY